MVIPDGAEKIGSYWFWGCKIKSVTVPASVKEICANAFRNSRKLMEVVFCAGSKLKTIGRCAFYECEKLTKIAFSDELETIGVECLYGCGLEVAVFPASWKEIGAMAFSRCR